MTGRSRGPDVVLSNTHGSPRSIAANAALDSLLLSGCNKATPNPCFAQSVRIKNGLEESARIRQGEERIASLNLAKSCSSSGVHAAFGIGACLNRLLSCRKGLISSSNHGIKL